LRTEKWPCINRRYSLPSIADCRRSRRVARSTGSGSGQGLLEPGHRESPGAAHPQPAHQLLELLRVGPGGELGGLALAARRAVWRHVRRHGHAARPQASARHRLAALLAVVDPHRVRQVRGDDVHHCIYWWLLLRDRQSLYSGEWMARVSRQLALTSGGALLQVYISEISSPDIRGFLSAIQKVSGHFGMLISYMLGAILDWRQLAMLVAVAPLMLFVTVIYIPETPSFLMLKGRDEDAYR
jgi:hypothetical protein